MLAAIMRPVDVLAFALGMLLEQLRTAMVESARRARQWDRIWFRLSR